MQHGMPFEETDHPSVAPPAEHTPGTPTRTSESIFRGKSGIILAAIGFLIIIIIATSTTLVLSTLPKTSVDSSSQDTGSYPSYLPGHGTLVLADPLDGTRSLAWKPATGCSYTHSHYQVTTSENPLHVCLGPHFRDFAFEVQMTIIKGDCGGIVLRADFKQNVFYNFLVCQLGVFSFAKYEGDRPGVGLLQPQRSPILNGDLHQSNTLGIYANGNTLMLYANSQRLGLIHDNASAEGKLGLDAIALSSNPTEVIYSNARVWTF